MNYVKETLGQLHCQQRRTAVWTFQHCKDTDLYCESQSLVGTGVFRLAGPWIPLVVSELICLCVCLATLLKCVTVIRLAYSDTFHCVVATHNHRSLLELKQLSLRAI